jgi:tetratricopeptide (TPR) repeat protein
MSNCSSHRLSVDRLLIPALIILVTTVCIRAQIAKPASTSLRPITVITEPHSIVWIDDVRYGETDEKGRITIASLSPGIRSLRVRANGFAEVTKSLPATTRGDVMITLTKTTDEADLAYQSAETASTIDRQKAITEYQRAIKLRPKFPAAFLGMARMYSETGDIEKAFQAVRSAKRLRPAYAEASAVEGRLLKDTDDEAKAIAAFKRSITEGKGFQPEAYTGLGLLYKDRAENFGGTGDFANETASYNEAAKYLSVAAKQLGTSPDAMVVIQLLGLVYERQKKFNEAITLYEEFLRLFPDSSEATAVQSFIVQIRKQMAQQK